MQTNQNSSQQEQTTNEDNNFTKVTYKKMKQVRKNIGTGKQSKGFSGQERKVWLYIYTVKRSTTTEIIEEYLSTKEGFQEVEIMVKEIPSEENRLKRFVLSAPLEKKEELYKLEFWPSGVGIKRFDFSKHKDLLQEGANFL
ncbi:uncharacterized protein LOC123314918 [Coccinella septempunctata]|uniref:uncharacterized protein LOC123314918 n=1 Tax=Coccinella septempunctata TaxID=41139 RepID=UPI001D06F50D|nr:uncharacterized protein LOC123314918 [Coccinella septempunctata]